MIADKRKKLIRAIPTTIPGVSAVVRGDARSDIREIEARADMQASGMICLSAGGESGVDTRGGWFVFAETHTALGVLSQNRETRLQQNASFCCNGTYKQAGASYRQARSDTRAERL